MAGFYCFSIVPTPPTSTKHSAQFTTGPLASSFPQPPITPCRSYTAANGSHLFIPFTARMAMDDLAERIRASIEDPTVDPWFPELTADLAARAWQSLHREIGLSPGSYST